MYKLTKWSEDGWELTSPHLHVIHNRLMNCVCSGCLRTKSEIREMYASLPNFTSDMTVGDPDDTYSVDVDNALPDDFVELSIQDQIDWLMSTSCGAEYGFEIIPQDVKNIFGGVVNNPQIYYYGFYIN